MSQDILKNLEFALSSEVIKKLMSNSGKTIGNFYNDLNKVLSLDEAAFDSRLNMLINNLMELVDSDSSEQTYFEKAASDFDEGMFRSIVRKVPLGKAFVTNITALIYTLRDPDVERLPKAIIFLFLLYLFFPVDVAMDFVPIAGWLDDWLLQALVNIFLSITNKEKFDKNKEKAKEWFGEAPISETTFEEDEEFDWSSWSPSDAEDKDSFSEDTSEVDNESKKSLMIEDKDEDSSDEIPLIGDLGEVNITPPAGKNLKIDDDDDDDEIIPFLTKEVPNKDQVNRYAVWCETVSLRDNYLDNILKQTTYGEMRTNLNNQIKSRQTQKKTPLAAEQVFKKKIDWAKTIADIKNDGEITSELLKDMKGNQRRMKRDYSKDALKAKGEPWNSDQCIRIFESAITSNHEAISLLNSYLKGKGNKKSDLFILNSLLKFSDYLDSEGLIKEADYIYSIVKEEVEKSSGE